MKQRFTEAYIRELADKWEQGVLTDAERADFEVWYRSHDDEAAELPAGYDKDEVIKRRLLNRLLSHMNPHHNEKVVRMRRARVWIAAASVMLLLGVGGYFYLDNHMRNHEEQPVALQDIAPGGNKAVLTLADGDKINLSAQQSGIVVGDQISYTDGTEVLDLAREATVPGESITLSTPKGGTYRVTLPDGTKVWLNAASSLTYPLRFAKDKRLVTLQGEGYFEVAEDQSRPFWVRSEKQTIKVLGTKFNVNCYKDEPHISTSLLEGSIRIVKNNSTESQLIIPGQQLKINRKNGQMQVKSADFMTTLAWKNGRLYFKDATIKEIMRQVSRWYDVDVIYEGALTKERFVGGISRSSSLATLLAILEDSGIHFRMEQMGGKKRLILMP